MQCSKLSEHDRSVLNAILNPLELGANSNFDDIHIDDFDTPENLADQTDEASPELTESMRMESQAVVLAETGDFKAALHQLGAAFNLTPNRASLYNNRAQVHRLAGNDECKYSDIIFKFK